MIYRVKFLQDYLQDQDILCDDYKKIPTPNGKGYFSYGQHVVIKSETTNEHAIIVYNSVIGKCMIHAPIPKSIEKISD